MRIGTGPGVLAGGFARDRYLNASLAGGVQVCNPPNQKLDQNLLSFKNVTA